MVCGLTKRAADLKRARQNLKVYLRSPFQAANANRWLDACIARKVYEMSDFVISYKDNGQSCKVIWSGLNAQNAIDTFWASFDERDRSKISYVRLFGLVEIFNASQQNFAPDVAICEDCGKSPAMEGCSVCAECGL